MLKEPVLLGPGFYRSIAIRFRAASLVAAGLALASLSHAAEAERRLHEVSIADPDIALIATLDHETLALLDYYETVYDQEELDCRALTVSVRERVRNNVPWDLMTTDYLTKHRTLFWAMINYFFWAYRGLVLVAKNHSVNCIAAVHEVLATDQLPQDLLDPIVEAEFSHTTWNNFPAEYHSVTTFQSPRFRSLRTDTSETFRPQRVVEGIAELSLFSRIGNTFRFLGNGLQFWSEEHRQEAGDAFAESLINLPATANGVISDTFSVASSVSQVTDEPSRHVEVCTVNIGRRSAQGVINPAEHVFLIVGDELVIDDDRGFFPKDQSMLLTEARRGAHCVPALHKGKWPEPFGVLRLLILEQWIKYTFRYSLLTFNCGAFVNAVLEFGGFENPRVQNAGIGSCKLLTSSSNDDLLHEYQAIVLDKVEAFQKFSDRLRSGQLLRFIDLKTLSHFDRGFERSGLLEVLRASATYGNSVNNAWNKRLLQSTGGHDTYYLDPDPASSLFWWDSSSIFAVGEYSLKDIVPYHDISWPDPSFAYGIPHAWAKYFWK